MPFDADCDTITIQCGECDAVGADVMVDQDVHTQSDLPSLKAEAIAAWNCRTPATIADTTEAQAAEIEELKSWKAAEDAHHHAMRAEIKRLREAGTKLAGFAGHDSECEDVTGAYPGSCSCGYSRAWKAWGAALGETE
jgi:excinuclease UvrABC ATPase subunit